MCCILSSILPEVYGQSSAKVQVFCVCTLMCSCISVQIYLWVCITNKLCCQNVCHLCTQEISHARSSLRAAPVFFSQGHRPIITGKLRATCSSPLASHIFTTVSFNNMLLRLGVMAFFFFGVKVKHCVWKDTFSFFKWLEIQGIILWDKM